MNILLTGATGFVGRNAILSALAGGHDVYVPVRSEEKLRAQLHFERADSSRVHPLPPEPEQWPRFWPHQAILGAGVLFARSRKEYFSTNVDWTLSILRALPADCRTIFLSSQSAGGPTPVGKQAREESDADQPMTWYGESKLAAEKAIRAEFSERPVTILRPPMVLGPRDAATLPLFRMARGPVRLKPGFRRKFYSFIAVGDLVEAMFSVLQKPPSGQSFYVASPEIISDLALIESASRAGKWRGVTFPIPQLTTQMLSLLVDAIPPLRSRVPSLTRDRVREIKPDRWVVDGSAFARFSGWQARCSLEETMQAACDYYLREGAL